MTGNGKMKWVMVVIIGFLMVNIESSLFQNEAIATEKNPTAIIVDAETNEPIEGAVAIAIWRKHSTKEAAWFEGGQMVVTRIEEVVSDKEGKIYIDDFFDWHLFDNRYPRLTIYKPGYVCWDQKQLYKAVDGSKERKDFDENNRAVRMEKWPKEFSFVEHDDFIEYCTGYGDISKAPKLLFYKAYESERKYRIKEGSKSGK